MRTLVIGNHNYSSWSLRAWLYLRESDLDFEVVRIPLFTDEWRGQISRYSPAGRVPVLIDGAARVWDSLAIVRHLEMSASEEEKRRLVGWPSDPVERGVAWSIVAEMHSGFLALREELPLNDARAGRRTLELTLEVERLTLP